MIVIIIIIIIIIIILIKEKMNTNSSEPTEELHINDYETRYDSEKIQELFRRSFDELYGFECFEKKRPMMIQKTM